MNSRADEEGLRDASGLRLHRIAQPQAPALPSPSSASKRGVSCGVEITRMSRMPASISVDSG